MTYFVRVSSASLQAKILVQEESYSMTRIAIATITLLVAALNVAQSQTFEPVGVEYGGGDLAEFTRDGDCIVAVGIGLFRSCDNGRSWMTIRDADGVLDAGARDVYVDPVSRRIVTKSSVGLKILDPASTW